MTYINVFQGTKIIPRIGQMFELKARFHFAGKNNHQMMAATRGPKRTKTVRKQHIAILLDDVNDP
jgi:hypothetical protein